jgi:prepilin-type N-terminal cleavage/methylation domain-containing protein
MISNNNLQRDSQKGFSLLELLLVVAVGAVLILAGLSAYRLVSENNNVNESLRLLNTLKQQVQTAYQGEGEYTGNINNTLIDLRAFPDGVLTSSGQARHPFGGDINFNANGNTFDIVFTGVGRAACIAVGQAFDSTSDSDLADFQIDGTDPDTGGDGITLADLQGACPGANDAGADMTWTFF